MGNRDPQDQGYPKSLQKKDWAIYRYCGGAGGGDCAQVQNNTHVSFAIDVNPFLVRNRSLLLRNPEFFGIVFYQDGGPSGFCDHSVSGGPQDWYLGFDADNTATDEEVIAQNLLQDNLTPPFDIEVAGKYLPQPTDPNWDDKIWCHIVWTDPQFVSDAVYVDDTQYLRVVKHNYDVRQ